VIATLCTKLRLLHYGVAYQGRISVDVFPFPGKDIESLQNRPLHFDLPGRSHFRRHHFNDVTDLSPDQPRMVSSFCPLPYSQQSRISNNHYRSLDSHYFCSPQEKIWNHSKTAAANILTDLFLVALFLVILRRLQLRRRERWGVVFFLMVSAIPILAAILRLTIIIRAMKPLRHRTMNDLKKFYDILYLASEIEVTTAFIAACLPGMRVFLREKKDSRRQYSMASNEYRGGNKAPPGTPRTPRPQTPRSVFLDTSRDSSSDGSQGFKWGNVYAHNDIDLETRGSRTGLWPPGR